MVTPHIAYLAEELCSRGFKVTFVTEESLSDERLALGWELPRLHRTEVVYANTSSRARELALTCDVDVIHITQGLRGNGHIIEAQKIIKTRKLKHYAVFETVDGRGLMGLIRNFVYFIILRKWVGNIDGILAIGYSTKPWVERLCGNSINVYNFAYFLNDVRHLVEADSTGVFRIIFVGALIRRKRVDLAIKALTNLTGNVCELHIVGDGPLRQRLEALAQPVLNKKIFFHGVLKNSDVLDQIRNSDCLLLPSDHDGWGAVASEALMVGTPVICSSGCGVSEVVIKSGYGGVFSKGNYISLMGVLAKVLSRGKLSSTSREHLRLWASCLGSRRGAEYLESIIETYGKNHLDKGFLP